MAINVLEMFTSAFGDEIASQASSFLGESESNTKSALGMIVPALLGSLMKHGATADGAAGLLKTLADSKVDTGLLGSLAGLLSGGHKTDTLVILGSSLVEQLFGDKAASLVSAIASLTGLKSSSSSNLLYMAAPLLFSWLKKLVLEKNMDAGGLMGLLGEQKDAVKASLPGALVGALGLGSLFGDEPEPSREKRQAAATPPPPVEEERSMLGRLLPWLAVGAGLLTALAIFKGAEKSGPETPESATPASVSVSPAIAPAPDAAAIALPAKVYFDVGSATVGPEGYRIIDAAAAGIKSNDLSVDITGYTDKTGDTAANAELAKQRAVAVRERLTAAGVAEGRINMKPPFAIDSTGSGSNAEARRVEISQSN